LLRDTKSTSEKLSGYNDSGGHDFQRH
jgi:hypothetical protein